MQKIARANASLSIIFALSACGGGGSSGVPNSVSYVPPPSSPTPTPTPTPGSVTTPTTTDFNTGEYRVSSAAIGANALPAWQLGATGKGIQIGFVDTGINPDLADFAGRVDPASRAVAGGTMSDGYGHGTANAGIAAAGRNDIGMMGIAYEATIVMMKADEGCPNACGFPYPNIVKGIDGARSAGARVVNISIGGVGDSSVKDAVKRAAGAGMVIVVGAGNFGLSPTGMATSIAGGAPNNTIIVGGLGVSNPDGSINWDLPSIYTTNAGMGINNFMTAPGWLNAGTGMDGLADFYSGTSFAAPVVSGAVALLAQAFPNLSGAQIVSLLFSTADDLGAPGLDDVFGHGRLNIGNAFKPQGTMRMASSAMTPSDALSGSLPQAAGDAGGGLYAIALDGLNRAYSVDLSTSLERTSTLGLVGQLTAPLQHTALSEFGSITVSTTVADQALNPRPGEPQRELANTAVTASIGSTSRIAFSTGIGGASLRELVGHGGTNGFLLSQRAEQSGLPASERSAIAFSRAITKLSVFAAAESGRVVGRRDAFGTGYSSISVGINRKIFGGGLGLTATCLAENGTLLGGTVRSIYAAPGSTTYFLDSDLNRSLGGGWSLAADYRRGWTASSYGRMTSSAFSIDLAKSGLFGGDRIAFRLSQPLRIENGGLTLSLPTNWDYATESSLTGKRSMSLSPSGREIALEAGYFRLIPNGSIDFHVFARRDPNHVAGSRPDIGSAIRAKMTL